MEECIGALQLRAEEREAALAAQTCRAEAAEAGAAELSAELARAQSAIAAQAAAHAEQVWDEPSIAKL